MEISMFSIFFFFSFSGKKTEGGDPDGILDMKGRLESQVK